MKTKRSRGISGFGFIYNLLGFLSLNASFFGMEPLVNAQYLHIEKLVFTQMVMICLTVLFFYASYHLFTLKVGGILIPVFLLTYMIVGGMHFLLPILLSHVIFFSQKNVRKQFPIRGALSSFILK